MSHNREEGAKATHAESSHARFVRPIDELANEGRGEGVIVSVRARAKEVRDLGSEPSLVGAGKLATAAASAGFSVATTAAAGLAGNTSPTNRDWGGGALSPYPAASAEQEFEKKGAIGIFKVAFPARPSQRATQGTAGIPFGKKTPDARSARRTS